MGLPTFPPSGKPYMLEETWRDISGYDGTYQVSNLGRVRSSLVAGSKLTIDDILKIKELVGSGKLLRQDIAEQFNVNKSTIYNIIKGIHRSNTERFKMLKLNPTKDGYRYVILCKNKIHKSMRVHRLVAFAFLDEIEAKDQINHKDGNRSNNNVDNLEWCNGSENSLHAYDIGLRKRGEKHVNAKISDVDVLNIKKMRFVDNVSVGAIAKFYNIHRSMIHLIYNNKKRFSKFID